MKNFDAYTQAIYIYFHHKSCEHFEKYGLKDKM